MPLLVTVSNMLKSPLALLSHVSANLCVVFKSTVWDICGESHLVDEEQQQNKVALKQAQFVYLNDLAKQH